MFLKSELLESNGSSVTLFQLSALQRIEHLEYLKQMEAVEGAIFRRPLHSP
jgi:phage minor tail protein G